MCDIITNMMQGLKKKNPWKDQSTFWQRAGNRSDPCGKPATLGSLGWTFCQCGGRWPACRGGRWSTPAMWDLVSFSPGTGAACTLQEGNGWLVVVSGRSLGRCLRVGCRNGAQLCDTVVISWAGRINDILAIPGLTNTNPTRIGSCVAYATVARALLY